MGCLFSSLTQKQNQDSRQKLMGNASPDEDDTEMDKKDIEDFSSKKTKQICVMGPTGTPSMKVSVNDFIFLTVLGKGTFGKVVLVEKKDTGNIYAMKILRKDVIIKQNQRAHTKTERDILQNMDSPFILKLHYAFQTPTKLYLITDFMNGGELFFHLRREKKFSESKAMFYAAEIILALEYLHNRGIIYRDLKSENILMDSEGHITICDFGLSKQGILGERKAYTFCGTPEYVAPEVLKGQGYDKAVDYWSLGALLYEMIAGVRPFYSKDRTEMFRNILERPVEMKPTFSPEAISLFSQLLVVDPRQRLNNPFLIKKHEFFKGMDWGSLAKKQVKPPFKPNVTGIRDLRYFDKMFTEENIGETPVGTQTSSYRMNNTFPGFSYDNTQFEKETPHKDNQQYLQIKY